MLEIVNAVYFNINAYNRNTQQVTLVPYFYAYQCNDGVLYTMEELLGLLDNKYGLTTLLYTRPNADGTGYIDEQVPAFKLTGNNCPCYSLGTLEHVFDQATLNDFIASLYRIGQQSQGDGLLWDVATGQYYQTAIPQQQPVQETKAKSREKAEPKAQPKPTPPTPKPESKTEVETPTPESVAETSEPTQADTLPTEEVRVKKEPKITFAELVEEATKSTPESITVSEDQPEQTPEERCAEFQDTLNAMGVSVNGALHNSETGEEVDLLEIDDDEACKTILKDKGIEVDFEVVREEVVTEEDAFEQTVEEEVEEEDVAPTENEEFKDKDIIVVSDKDIAAQLEAIKKDPTSNFMPNVRMHKDLVCQLTEEEVRDLYYMVSNGITNYSYDKEKVDEVRLHFGECGYPIKVIFDAFSTDEILGMLHFEIVNPSPTGLYDGIYRALFLYRLYYLNKGWSEETIQAYIVIKLTYLSTMTQAMIAYEEASKNDDEDDLRESSIILTNDLLSETNGHFRTFIADEILNVTYRGENGEELSKLDYIRYLCQLGFTGRFLSVHESHFTRLVGFKDLKIQINPKSIVFYSGSIELCPNVVGIMYNTYLRNINDYVMDKVLQSYTIEDIPVRVLLEGINYNQMLDDLKTSEDFKHVTKMSAYEYLSQVNKMNLKILCGIVPLIRGKSVPKILGFICTDTEDIDAERKYFIPFVGKCLSQLNDLQVTFTTNVDIIKKNFKGDDLFLLKADKTFLTTNNISLKAVSCEFDENFTLDKLVGNINNVVELRTTVLPKFVKNSEGSTLLGYKAFGLYNPIM